MRKLTFALFALPAAAMAQGLPSAQFESVAGNLLGILSGPVFSVMLILVVIGAGLAFVFGDNKGLGKFLLAPVFMLANLKMVSSIFDVGSSPEMVSAPPPARQVPEEPGMISVAWDWVVSHLLIFGITFGVIILGSYLVSRAAGKRAARKRVKADLQGVLETIELGDMLLMYWQSQAAAAGLSDAKKQRANDAVSTVKQLREQLFGMLEKVHSGSPLTDAQNKQLNRIRERLNDCMKDEIGLPVDVAAELATIKQAEPATAPVAPPAAAPRVQLAAASAAPSVEPRSSLTGDLLNPLNPLSPISPWSVWNRGHNEPAAHHTDTSESSASWASSGNDSSSTELERTTSFACSSDDDSRSSWSGSDSSSDSSSCSSDSSSDNSSSSNF